MKYYFITLADGSGAPGMCYSDTLPDGAVACTQEQYENSANYMLENGVVVPFTPPAVTVAQQAVTALAAARTYVSNTYTMLNEATPDAWVTYLKALMAIANGADTTSTALPNAPAA